MNTVNPIQLALELQALAAARGLSQVEIAIGAGMSQPQASRILNGRFRKISKRVMQLCKFLEYSAVDPKIPQRPSKKLEEAVMDAWDGSRLHEDALINLLRALRPAMREKE